jgi:PD-(D/E)XK nuclease superfamily protein
VLTTDQKGAVAELAIARAAAELGIGVWGPYTVERYDLVFDLRPELARVQCKWATRRGDIIVVPCHTNRRNRVGLVRTFYSSDEIDAFAAYCADTDRCYFLSLKTFAGRSAIQLRLAPTKNNQQAGVNWARDFEFAATLAPRGAIAQLGERCHGMAEVAGSIPAGSTHRPPSEGGWSGPQRTPRPTGPPPG